jgi:serine/threonine protein kinase
MLAGRYRIIAALGKGGMGEVYRADDLKLGQPVALKFLPQHLAGDPTRLSYLRNEVRLARQVSHPNVCRVHDIGEADGQPFLSMEFVDGEDLASLLRRIGCLPPDKAREIARQLCFGLAAAHDKGVLHCDLKPANVMLDGQGQVRITDFGLARLADQLGGQGNAGTPAYMAPEQLAGNAATDRSDIYALGLLLYEIFTGKRARSQGQSVPPPPSIYVSDLDEATQKVILRCLKHDPRNRWSSALAVAAALTSSESFVSKNMEAEEDNALPHWMPLQERFMRLVAGKSSGCVHPSYRVYEPIGPHACEERRAALPPGCISVACPQAPPPWGAREEPAYILSISKLTSVQQLLDEVYLGFLKDRFPPETYGSRWVLGRCCFRDRLVVPLDWVVASNKSQYRLSVEWSTETSLQATGILAGTDWYAFEPSSCECPLGLAVNDASIIEIIARNPKAVSAFLETGILQKGDLVSVDNGRFSHIAVIAGGAFLRWDKQNDGTEIVQEGPVPLTEKDRARWH